MAKEQVTLSLSPQLLEELKQTAQRTNQSLSSVIESYLCANSLSGRTVIEKALEIAQELKEEVSKSSDK